MSEIPSYVRTATVTTLSDTDYIIIDDPNSDVTKKITYSDFKVDAGIGDSNQSYTNNFLFMGS